NNNIWASISWPTKTDSGDINVLVKDAFQIDPELRDTKFTCLNLAGLYRTKHRIQFGASFKRRTKALTNQLLETLWIHSDHEVNTGWRGRWRCRATGMHERVSPYLFSGSAYLFRCSRELLGRNSLKSTSRSGLCICGCFGGVCQKAMCRERLSSLAHYRGS